MVWWPEQRWGWCGGNSRPGYPWSFDRTPLSPRTIRREHLLSSLWAALISGAIGSALMWAVGSRLGSVDIAGLSATIDDKVVVDAPLTLMMPAILLVWPATAALVVTVVAFADWWAEFRRSQRER